VTASGSSTNTQLPLVYQSNLQYLGGFRIPQESSSTSNGYNYAGKGLAFNPANNSLFIAGYGINNTVGEISIPSSIVNSTNLNNLATASVLQPLVQVLNRVPNTSNLGDGSWATKGQIDLGGLSVVNGQLLGTAYVNYDTSGTTVVTHYRYDSLNLTTATVEGMFQVGNSGMDAAFYDGYMAPIPANWQSALGASYLTGNSGLAIVGRTSSGPAAFGFDPSTLNISSPSSATPYVYYPLTNPLGQYGSTSLLFDENTNYSGIFFVPGSRTVLYFGDAGTNTSWYGTSSIFTDNNRTGKGAHSGNGDYTYQAWAYDANDLLAVKNGQMQPWQLQPYATWNFDFPQYEGGKYIGGVAFDPATSRLYITQLGADTQAAYTYLPVVQVYQLTLSSSGSPSVQLSVSQAATASPSVASGNTSNTTIAVSTIAAPAVSSADSSPQISLAGPVSQATPGSTTSRKRLHATLPPPSGTVSLLQLGSRGSIWTRSVKSKGLTNFKSPGSLIEP
jgi:hypothetical protein